jgi:hypothetical protein
MITVVGIDPGISGGFGIVSDNGAHAFSMPETPRDIIDLFKEFKIYGELICYLEKVRGMPNQAHNSTWTFAKNVGHLEMAMTGLGYKFEEVRPQDWQKELGCLTHGNKNISKKKAQELFPELKITHAKADALLIAEYGRRRQK